MTSSCTHIFFLWWIACIRKRAYPVVYSCLSLKIWGENSSIHYFVAWLRQKPVVHCYAYVFGFTLMNIIIQFGHGFLCMRLLRKTVFPWLKIFCTKRISKPLNVFGRVLEERILFYKILVRHTYGCKRQKTMQNELAVECIFTVINLISSRPYQRVETWKRVGKESLENGMKVWLFGCNITIFLKILAEAIILSKFSSRIQVNNWTRHTKILQYYI